MNGLGNHYNVTLRTTVQVRQNQCQVDLQIDAIYTSCVCVYIYIYVVGVYRVVTYFHVLVYTISLPAFKQSQLLPLQGCQCTSLHFSVVSSLLSPT